MLPRARQQVAPEELRRAETARGESKGKLSSCEVYPRCEATSGACVPQVGGEWELYRTPPSSRFQSGRRGRRDDARLAGESRQGLSDWGGLGGSDVHEIGEIRGKLGCGLGFGSRDSQVNVGDQCRWEANIRGGSCAAM